MKRTNKEERMKQRRREMKQKQQFREFMLKLREDLMNGKPAPYNVMATLPDIQPDFKVKVR